MVWVFYFNGASAILCLLPLVQCYKMPSISLNCMTYWMRRFSVCLRRDRHGADALLRSGLRGGLGCKYPGHVPGLSWSKYCPSRRVARRSLRTTDIGHRDNAPETVGGSPSETSEVFWSIDVPVPLQVKSWLFERN